jgi:enamine deaminase RidA (YjgF/YER057c/UK114 family)
MKNRGELAPARNRLLWKLRRVNEHRAQATAFDLATQREHSILWTIDRRGKCRARFRRGRKAIRKAALVGPTVTSVGLVLAMLLSSAARGDEARLSIGGYDPVAYFTDGRPVQGKPDLEYLWHRSRWRFASVSHRDTFVKDPDRYTPQYDGYCAMGTSEGAVAHKDTVDPEAWAIVDGKLYFTHNPHALLVWREKAAEHIKRGDQDWQQAVKKLPAPEIVGPPCAASPPTTKVALRDGGYWVVVAGQLARDQAGNVVGKGDLKAQIEQVGKNVGACLAAGGASVKDIIFTISYATQPAAFEKYADLRERFFGPPTPQSAIVPMPQSAGPDYLVQVEAFAATK